MFSTRRLPRSIADACAIALLRIGRRGQPSRSASASAWRRPDRSPPTASRRCWRCRSGATTSTPRAGCLGRPVGFVVYDDQNNTSTVPGLYTKLLDVDKVDLGRVRLRHQRDRPGDAGDHPAQAHISVAVRPGGERTVPLSKLFHGHPDRPDPTVSSTIGFFEVGEAAEPQAIDPGDRSPPMPNIPVPRPRACARTPRNSAGKWCTTRPIRPTPPISSPIVRAVQATSPDAVFVASYPLDSVGMVRAASEVGLTTKLFGGGMVQAMDTTSVKQQLGPLLGRYRQLRFLDPGQDAAIPRGGRLS